MSQDGPYRVFHWDTFDEPGEDTTEIGWFGRLTEAVSFVENRYKGRIRDDGADQVHIVDHSGKVVKRYHVG